MDHVLDAHGRHASLANGHEWMTRITGVGCSASALIGAFCAVQPDAWRATVSAMAYLGVVGEVATAQVQAQGLGWAVYKSPCWTSCSCWTRRRLKVG